MEGNTHTEFEKLRLTSIVDGLPLAIEVIEPIGPIYGVIQISHGMAEHKERYRDFMQFLSAHGYVVAIHDHRGHGGSVRDVSDLGYFYTDNAQVIVEDLHDVTAFLQKRYPGYSIYMFSHSMGTLVARKYLKRYDHQLSKVILCGPPTKNETIHLAILLAQISSKIHGELYRNHFLNQLVFGPANKKFGAVNAWLSSDAAEVERYIYDPLCGYIFTNNGFLNLFELQKDAFDANGWIIRNSELPIFLIAGEDDPVIRGEKKFFQLETFLKQVGYQNVSAKLYKGMRHELLNETGKRQLYHDILAFLSKKPYS